jgi:methyl-accepting chemotaxis protein
MTAQERRRKLLVDKPTQLHFIRLLAFIVLAAMVAFVIVTLSHHGGQVNKPIQLIVALLLATIMILIGVVYVGLRFSNKIVGPIYAFGRNLKLVQQGNYTGELHLRHGDEFQNLAGVFNLTVEALRQRIHDDLAFLEKLASELEQLGAANPQTKNALALLIQEQRSLKERCITKP